MTGILKKTLKTDVFPQGKTSVFLVPGSRMEPSGSMSAVFRTDVLLPALYVYVMIIK